LSWSAAEGQAVGLSGLVITALFDECACVDIYHHYRKDGILKRAAHWLLIYRACFCFTTFPIYWVLCLDFLVALDFEWFSVITSPLSRSLSWSAAEGQAVGLSGLVSGLIYFGE